MCLHSLCRWNSEILEGSGIHPVCKLRFLYEWRIKRAYPGLKQKPCFGAPLISSNLYNQHLWNVPLSKYRACFHSSLIMCFPNALQLDASKFLLCLLYFVFSLPRPPLSNPTLWASLWVTKSILANFPANRIFLEFFPPLVDGLPLK